MSKKLQPKIKLPGKLPDSKNVPAQPKTTPYGWSTQPLNQDLALHRKYIELIIKKWNASSSEVGELLETSNWKKWICFVAKSENKVEMFRDEKVLCSFAETLVELICDPSGLQDPWRHKLLCSKLNDKQMEQLSKLIEIREEMECAKLLADDSEHANLLDDELQCWSPVLDAEDVTFVKDKFIDSQKKDGPRSDLFFAEVGTTFLDDLRKKRRRKPKKQPIKMKLTTASAPAFTQAPAFKKLMAADKEVSMDNRGPPRSPPHSPPIKIIPSYNKVLEGPMEKLELEKSSEGHPTPDENVERIKMVIALKYPKPSEEAPELTPRMFEILKEALERSYFDPQECLCEFNGLKYKMEDLAVLNDRTAWLNDRNIDFYLELIKDRGSGDNGYLKVYVFHCFFYTMLVDKDCSFDVLKEATEGEDLTQFDLVFFPVNLNDHWRLVVADFRNGSLKCYDSMGPHQEENEQVLKTLLSYLKREFLRKNKKGHLVFFRCWLLENVDEESIPQQENAIDCGVFLLQFAEYLSRDQKLFDFEQKHVPYFRKKMMYETLTKRILPPKQAVN